MAIKSRKNQYLGVNAHLHSELQQTRAGWEGMHTQLIVRLADTLNMVLPAGYVVDIEQSLQIREYDPHTGLPTLMGRAAILKPDVAVYGSEAPITASSGHVRGETAPTLEIPASDTIELDFDAYLHSVVIRQIEDDQTLGQSVAWIEILSPTNKRGGSGHTQYISKRIATLRNGIVLLEIDYLHETPPAVGAIPDYTKRQSGSFPYVVTVTDPRPDLSTGKAKFYGFRVDDPLPRIALPLLKDDVVLLDLGEVYERAFMGVNANSYRVDYEEEPANMETYDEVDQARIRARMQAVQDAHARGVDLETGPFVPDSA